MMEEWKVKGVDIYKKHAFDCRCGRHHTMPVGKVVIGPDVARTLPTQLEALGMTGKGMLVTDAVVYQVLGEALLAQWQEEDLAVSVYTLPEGSRSDERALGNILCHLSEDTGFLISLGGGMVTDTVRYLASRMGLPCVAIPSAMTMDGFFTNMSVIIIDDLQKTHYLDYPTLILADTAIIASAPPRMNAAGIGEVVSKISAAIDWYSGKMVKDLYYCEAVEAMMASCIEKGASQETAEGIAVGNPVAVGRLTDALYRSAVAMAWYGSSPCGSGAEHQLNHYWVMCQENRGIPQSMHGQMVGVGAVVNLKLWQYILALDEGTFDIQKALDSIWGERKWQEGIRRVYGTGAEEIFDVQRDNHSFDPVVRQQEIHRILEALPALREKAAALPNADTIARWLAIAGAPRTPKELGITEEELMDSLYYAKESRAGRYNALWIIEALGLLPEVSARLCREMGYRE
ncbi:MAG: iron-containing alcohol dehydrogenase [Eubacterium aggregans]|uniref:iron-containing alcohol dehydrogenase n=1 Tax=Eubacterium aggregans TaxID=81409 RepID=UPI002B1FFE05|nr:iron-containing alcohol dehydrogenase [Eubacterium aggregans]MEA5074122.1 iron-containing alcohol dehydrogenase [Eubacterium aggregans]